MLDLRLICHGIVFVQARDIVDLRDQAVLMDHVMDAEISRVYVSAECQLRFHAGDRRGQRTAAKMRGSRLERNIDIPIFGYFSHQAENFRLTHFT